MAARIGKAEKIARVDSIRRMLATGGTRSDCLEFAAREWGIAPRSADSYIAEANQQIIEDFALERQKYTAQLLSVLHRVMSEGTRTNQMGAAVFRVGRCID